jgi:putative transcriptional regulator
MVEVLRNKNQATRLQILVEIANSGLSIQQRDIAERLEITPQAISDYISQLVGEGMLISEGRSSYRITNDGVNWIIKMLRELSDYTTYIQKSVTNISVCAAIAESDLEKSQKVGLEMKDGLLVATTKGSHEATGITTTSAKAGEDIGINSIEGIVPLQIGTIVILKIPSIQSGGSRAVDSIKLKKYLKRSSFTVALGLEALVALQNIKAEFHRYGAVDAAIEAARSGLSPFIVCAENETADLIARLGKANISYELADVKSS